MGRGRYRLLAVSLVAIVFVLMADAAFAQCAMCRTALRSPEGQRMVGALRQGILLLLVAPFTVFGIVATLAVRGQRRRHGDSSDEGGSDDPQRQP